jgi:simple sugar transport system substrate-binding protein
MRITKIFIIVGLCLVLAAGVGFAADKKLKAGFIYVGPVGDYGWSHAHDMGRKFAEQKLPWLETVFIESVAEADSARIIDRLVQGEKCDVVFTTSFGYMEDTVKAGGRYPDKKFMHCSGFKQAPNVGTYFGDLYQTYYLNGLMAGALTKTDKIGYVGAFPIPEVVRHIDAFALGIKTTNPKAKVHVKWIYAWYGPDKAREAAESLIAEGCDNLASRNTAKRASRFTRTAITAPCSSTARIRWCPDSSWTGVLCMSKFYRICMTAPGNLWTIGG